MSIRKRVNAMIDDEKVQRMIHHAAELDAAEKKRMDIERNVFIIGLGFVMGYFGYDLIDYIRAFF